LHKGARCLNIFPILKLNQKFNVIKHHAASSGVLNKLSKLLSVDILRPKGRGIEPGEIKIDSHFLIEHMDLFICAIT
jgi:hypothetical protein